jgi:septum formation protein
MKIILGSASKGRQAILKEMGLEFEVIPSEIDEKLFRSDDPKELTMTLARAKAASLIDRIKEPAILITSDNVVVCSGEIREKPVNAEEARKFLKSYGAYPVESYSSVVVTNLATKKSAEGTDVARVYFSPFTDEEIEKLIVVGDVFKLAGGFSPRGEFWSEHVKKIEGGLDGAVGLSKELTRKLINEVSQ